MRDIEFFVIANQAKIFHMGLKAAPARSTRSDAFDLRHWRSYHALVVTLIARARERYAKELLDIHLDATVHALVHRTWTRSPSIFVFA